MMLRKILMYDVFMAPFDFAKFTERREGKIFIFSIVYLWFASMITYGLVKLTMFDWQFTLVIYLLSLSVNSVLINKSSREYMLFLDRRPNSLATKLLHIFTGPYGILKFFYIIMCLNVLSHHSTGVVKAVLSVPTKQFGRQIRAENPIMDSIAKYQKRLKDYS